MGRAQTTPERVGNVLSKEKGVSQKTGNDYFKCKIDTSSHELVATGRDFEVLHDANPPFPIRYNVGKNKKLEDAFLNDVELISPDDEDCPEPPSKAMMQDADPMAREKNITASWAVQNALIQLHYEMNEGKTEFDPIRLSELAVEFVKVQRFVVDYIGKEHG